MNKRRERQFKKYFDTMESLFAEKLVSYKDYLTIRKAIIEKYEKEESEKK